MEVPAVETAPPPSEGQPSSILEARRAARAGLAAELRSGAAPAPQPSEGTPPEEPAQEPAEPRESAPTEAQPETPPDVPADEPGSDEPEARPADGSESPALTALIDGLEPDARYFLEQRTGKTEGFTIEDINKTFADAKDYNNRLAQFAKEEKASEEPGEEPAPEEESSEDQAFTPPSPAQVEADVKQATSQDTECSKLVETYIVNSNQIDELSRRTLPSLQKERERLELRLEIEEVKEDPIKSADIKDSLRDLRDRVRDAKDALAELRAEQKDLGERYGERSKRIRDYIAGEYEKQARAERQKVEQEAAVTTRAKKISTAWMPAVARAIEAHKIPKVSVGRFKKFARMAGLAEIGPIEDVDSFVHGVGREFAAMLDEDHRARSGQYAEKARARASTASTPTTQPSPGPPMETSRRGQPLSQVMRQVRGEFKRDLRG